MKCFSLAAALFLTQLSAAEDWSLPFPPPHAEAKIAPPQSRCKPCKCPSDCQCPPVCFEQGHPVSDACLPEGYLAPASISLRCGKDVFVTGSFIYWEAIQEGMDLAVPGQARTLTPLGTTTMSAAGQRVLLQDFAFKPGFQVGMGKTFGCDGWTVYGEYTRVRGHTQIARVAPASPITFLNSNGNNITPFGIWFPSSWMPDEYANTETNFISSRWDYALDIGDLEFLRPSYVGTSFILEPLFGLRGLWIRQKVNIQTVNLSVAEILPGPFRVGRYSSHSWAVGPLAGFNGKWYWGSVFHWIGDCSASLLYTRYTKVLQDVTSPDVALPPVSASLIDHNTLRANLNFSIGFGLGSYMKCRRMHWDLAVTYDFNAFWHQNMMRYLADLTTSLGLQINGTPSDLFLQGLTVKGSWEF